MIMRTGDPQDLTIPPAGLPGLLVVQRDGHHHPQHQPLDGLAAAGQELAQAAGHRRQNHVVDLGVVGVGDLLGHLQAAAHDGQPAL